RGLVGRVRPCRGPRPPSRRQVARAARGDVALRGGDGVWRRRRAGRRARAARRRLRVLLARARHRRPPARGSAAGGRVGERRRVLLPRIPSRGECPVRRVEVKYLTSRYSRLRLRRGRSTLRPWTTTKPKRLIARGPREGTGRKARLLPDP